MQALFYLKRSSIFAIEMEDLPRFYLPQAQLGLRLNLDEEEWRHAKVLRLGDNSAVHVVTGVGELFIGFITPAKRGASILIDQLLTSKPRPERRLILAVAPTKNMARFEWIIEKSVEIGVDEIIPLQCENSERIHLKRERLDRIAISALKQSKNLWMPEIHEVVKFDSMRDFKTDSNWIAHCLDSEKNSIHELSTTSCSQLICIGPEGDFSSKELDMAIAFGFKPLSLGEHRLRTETAAITACIAANLLYH